ncbi:unnamed protein product [Clonostachys chloroleuca]|uniref:Arginine metabolism regulation protein II n=1 Tax=Clonostachys chloroleuca TaxID=1926264 RepID=A0AA35QEV2_9HYPO|nr:unnamed protein product [Clonostachys chloroleuca]
MCQSLLATRPSNLATTLVEVDDESKTFEARASGEFSVGPFGVFKVNHNKSVETPSSSRPSPISEQHRTLDTAPPVAEPLPFISRFPSPEDGLSGPVDFLQWADLFTWDEDITGINTAQPSNFAPCALDTVVAETWTWPIGQEIDTGCDVINNPDSGVQQGPQDPLWPEIDLAVDVPMLFRHFNDHVIDQMGSLPIHEKSAWRILNLSSALMTLNEMTILLTNRENIKHAPLANFYAVIAVSAFHLSLNFASFPDPPRTVAHWKRLTNQAYAAAKLHINLTLEKESLAPGKAKYKDQLMSINATLATAVLSGNERDSRRYLTEMERVIRLRGLTGKGISRRARLLHQVYAWMRIVSESTNVLHEDSTLDEDTSDGNQNSETGRSFARAPTHHYHHPVQAMPTRHHDVTLDNFLRLEPRVPSGQGLNPHVQKEDSDSSVGDIHMPDARQDRDSVCMQIYGVPETWLSLVSQTTRLANVMERLTASKNPLDAEHLASLQPRASRLENTICTFVSNNQTTNTTESGILDTNRPHMHMLKALNSALMIYFYRRVRNINPWAMRHDISDVIESLEEFDSSLGQNGLLGPGTAWAAFVAGAEAMTAKQRGQIVAWLDAASAKSGFRVQGDTRGDLETAGRAHFPRREDWDADGAGVPDVDGGLSSSSSVAAAVLGLRTKLSIR